jgi:hypothetical protein
MIADFQKWHGGFVSTYWCFLLYLSYFARYKTLDMIRHSTSTDFDSFNMSFLHPRGNLFGTFNLEKAVLPFRNLPLIYCFWISIYVLVCDYSNANYLFP